MRIARTPLVGVLTLLILAAPIPGETQPAARSSRIAFISTTSPGGLACDRRLPPWTNLMLGILYSQATEDGSYIPPPPLIHWSDDMLTRYEMAVGTDTSKYVRLNAGTVPMT